MNILFYHVDGMGRDAADGGAIFDRKTIAALRGQGAEVEEVPVHRRRAIRLPAWAGRIEDPQLAGQADKSDGKVILSHEATFDLATLLSVDILIVHNYFSGFTFPGQRGLQLYYRLGSMRHSGRAFNQAQSIIFLSHRERAIAEQDFPQIRGRTSVCPPPPATVRLQERRMDIVHVSGSEEWLPKRLSRLSQNELASFEHAGFKIADFGSEPSPSFGLINDRFTVGFKLKLMQMIQCRDVIASCADIAAEMQAIVPNYPFWRQTGSVQEAQAYFSDIRGRLTPQEIDLAFERHESLWRIPDWADHGRAILDALPQS